MSMSSSFQQELSIANKLVILRMTKGMSVLDVS